MLKVEDTTMDGRSIQTIFHLKSENTLVENQVQPWGYCPPPTFADSVSGSMKTGDRKYPRLSPQNKVRVKLYPSRYLFRNSTTLPINGIMN